MLDPECFEYLPDFLPVKIADDALDCLLAELHWQQQKITLFGRAVLQPRLTAWYGEPGAAYSYSGLSLDPLPWHPALLDLKTRIETSTGAGFNSVLANAYRDGQDSMGWHRDDEKELGDQPVIASLSLGAERRFLIRENGRPSLPLMLGHGSLLVMKGDSQRRYQHSLPKTRRAVGPRLNLTYRMIQGRRISDRRRRSGE